MKSKEMKIGSPEWKQAWKRMLAESIVVRSVLDQSHHSLEFLTEIFVLHEGNLSIMRIERSSAISHTVAKRPSEFCEHYAAPVEALLDNLGQCWEQSSVLSCIPTKEVMVALPTRGFIRPLGITEFLIESAYHPVFMAFYGTVRAWFHDHGKKYFTDPSLGIMLTHRFDAFLYQQELSMLQNTLGQVALRTET